MEKDIKAHIITRLNIESRVFIPRMFLINEGKCSFMIKQRQIPLRSGYIMTINKSQRKSLKMDGVFLKEQVFTYDKLYVVVSRVNSKMDQNYHSECFECLDSNFILSNVMSY